MASSSSAYPRPLVMRPNPPAIVRIGGRLHEYLLAGAIAIWFAAVQFPLILLDRPIFDPLENDVNVLRFVPFAVGLLALVNLAFLGRFARQVQFYGTQNGAGLWWIVGSSAAVLVASIVHGLVSSVLYSLVLLFISLNLALLWVINIQVARRCFRLLFAISAITAVAPLLLYGMPHGRFVGGIHPNLYGAVLLGMGFFWVLGFDRFNAVALLFPLGLAALVSSRYAFLALMIFSAFVFGFDRRISAGMKLMLALLGLFILLLPPVRAMLYDIFLIGDYERGLGSGVSGRFDLYTTFLPQIQDSPWIGYGFRARDQYETSHNGLLATLLENGLLVGGILFAWIAVRFVAALAAAISTGQRIYAYVAGGLLAVTVGAFFQPQLFNFGDAMGLSFLLFLAAPIVQRPQLRLGHAPPNQLAPPRLAPPRLAPARSGRSR